MKATSKSLAKLASFYFCLLYACKISCSFQLSAGSLLKNTPHQTVFSRSASLQTDVDNNYTPRSRIKNEQNHLSSLYAQANRQLILNENLAVRKEPRKNQVLSSSSEDDDHILLNEIISSFTTGDDEIILKQYIDEYIEYTDTSFYKSIYGKKALLEKFNKDLTEGKSKSFFGHDYLNSYVNIKDIVISNNESNGQLSKLVIVYTKVPNQKIEIADSIKDGYGKCTQFIENYPGTYGIAIFNIEDNKIKEYFDVSQHVDDTSVLDRKFASKANIMGDGGDDVQSKPAMLSEHSSAIAVVRTMLERRHEYYDVDGHDMGILASDCLLLPHSKEQVLQGKAAISSFITQMFESSSSSVERLKFVTEDIFASSSYQNDIRIIAKWQILHNDEMVGLSRGCSYYVLKHCHDENNSSGIKIDLGIDILESIKIEESQAHSIRNVVTPAIQNYFRDSGLARFIADSLVKLSVPSLAVDNPSAILDFIDLTNRMKQISYGQHKSQVVDLILPDSSAVKGVAFFVHGGAWGSGERWMYRLVSTTFLQEQMAVAIVGYRTYPDGRVNDQVNDLRAAFSVLKAKFPALVQRPYGYQRMDR